MSEYINKHNAYELLKHEADLHMYSYSKDAYKRAAIIVDQMPKENVESVIYCKDCRHCNKIDDEYYVCGMLSDECKCVITEGDRYCWWGENE